MTRRYWQGALKDALPPAQYRFVDVDADPSGTGWVAYILHPSTLQRMVFVTLIDRETSIPLVRKAVEGLRPAPNPDVTMLPHHPGP